jgi:hypothetical protein
MTNLNHLIENQKDSGENLPTESNHESNSTSTRDCSKFDSCSAPLCPLTGEIGIWYPDEEVCSNHQFRSERAIRNQRKIAQRTKLPDTYYTYWMLDRDIVIKPGIRGLDPDEAIEQEQRCQAEWIRDHPEKRTLSDEERKEIGERLSKARGKHPGE